jgi:hypothetical protein
VIRRVVVDPDVATDGLPAEVDVVVGPIEVEPHEPREVVVASRDPERLAEAGRLGVHRLVVDDPTAAAEALVELCRDLAHRGGQPTG